MTDTQTLNHTLTEIPARYERELEACCAKFAERVKPEQLVAYRSLLKAQCLEFILIRQRLLKRANLVLANLWPSVNGELAALVAYAGVASDWRSARAAIPEDWPESEVGLGWRIEPFEQPVRYVFRLPGVLSVYVADSWELLARSMPGKPSELDHSVVLAGEPKTGK